MAIENVENPLFKKQEEGDLRKLLSKDLMRLFENRPVFKFNFYSRIKGVLLIWIIFILLIIFLH